VQEHSAQPTDLAVHTVGRAELHGSAA
jgi:hypothetical protein